MLRGVALHLALTIFSFLCVAMPSALRLSPSASVFFVLFFPVFRSVSFFHICGDAAKTQSIGSECCFVCVRGPLRYLLSFLRRSSTSVRSDRPVHNALLSFFGSSVCLLFSPGVTRLS